MSLSLAKNPVLDSNGLRFKHLASAKSAEESTSAKSAVIKDPV